jgi:hypothetical protein
MSNASSEGNHRERSPVHRSALGSTYEQLLTGDFERGEAPAVFGIDRHRGLARPDREHPVSIVFRSCER